MVRREFLLLSWAISKLSFRANLAKRNASSIKMSYNVFGDSDSSVPPLVIMHGLFGSKQNWRSISKAVEAKSDPKRKVIAVDARNHGESPHNDNHSYKHLAADMEQLFMDLNIKKAVLMGHSMGGRAVMYFTLKHPQLVDRAVIVDISPVNTSRSFNEMGCIFNAMKTINIQPNLTLSEGRKKAQEYLLKTVRNATTVDFLLLNLRKSEQKGFYWTANVIALNDHFDCVSSFPKHELTSLIYNGPVLFVGGTKSDFINEAEFPQVKEMFPNAKLVWLDTGHLVQLEKPAEFISLVMNFINVE